MTVHAAVLPDHVLKELHRGQRGIGDKRMEIIAQQRVTVPLPHQVRGAQVDPACFGSTKHRFEMALQFLIEIPAGVR
jgi:hypothetical protein